MAGNFDRIRCIGAGSFGNVWLVKYTANNRKYVLKEVKVRGLSDKEVDQAVTEVSEAQHSWFQTISLLN